MRLIVFDVDGTLIDSVALIVETVTAALTALDEPVPDETTIRSMSGLTLDIAMTRVAPHASPERIQAIAARYREEYRARAIGSGREPLFPGARAALDSLVARDDTLLAVATGKGRAGAERLLADHGLSDYFTSIQTPDTNPSKPNPDMIVSAMDMVGAGRHETVMIGDTNHDMEMAVAAGVKAIGVRWGYHEVDDLTRAGADTIIEHFDELAGTIDRLLGPQHA